ncbi:hypothetical protein ACEWY4_004987 [Coilia grayii]|uniref:C1q domain-containing protein n=1 Tax=Coilia grayii TaxID=363190 RepID=A0ABD1KHF9_9TELE
MKTPGAVLLLLWWGLLVVAAESGGVQYEGAASTQQTCQPDIHTVLREMSALLAEQRVELRATKTQLEAMEKKAESTETRLRATESGGVQHEGAASTQQTCKPDIYSMLTEMSALLAEQRVELRATKTQLEAMEKKAESTETRLRASEKTVEEQRAVIRELKDKQVEQAAALRAQAAALRAVGDSVTLTGSQVEDLRRDREGRKVSFSATLGDGYFGPFTVSTTLVFGNVITNIGSAYNPNTGVFTAPVRGVYHFVFFLLGDGHASNPTGAWLYKNDKYTVMAYSKQESQYVKPSNGASLVLEAGDVVYIKLYPNAWVRDNENGHTAFSGHLLFTM